MLVRFDSKEGTFTMTGDVAVKLLRMMGHSGTVPSAILAADVPAALARFETALASAPAEVPPSGDEDGEDDEKRRDFVPLRHRAVPMLDLLRRSAAARVDVMWMAE